MREELSDAEAREIFAEEIVAAIDGLIKSQCASRQNVTGESQSRSPVVVFVGGQPGAGKSRALGRAAEEFPGIVAVVGDDLRIYHPDYDEIMATDPLRMPQVTAQASGQWVGMSIDYLRDERADVLVETTLRQVDVVAGTMGRFREAGYRVELHVVAVPVEVSRLGTVSRYINQVVENGVGRWTPTSAHDQAATAVPATAAALVDQGLVDRVVIEDRDGTVLYRHDQAGRLRCASEVAQAIDTARRVENMDPRVAAAWLATAQKDIAACVHTGQSDPDLHSAIMQIAADAPAVARVAYGHDKTRAVTQIRASASALTAGTTPLTAQETQVVNATDRASRLHAASFPATPAKPGDVRDRIAANLHDYRPGLGARRDPGASKGLGR